MEYSLDFAKRLIDAADSFTSGGKENDEVNRAILYLSLLSCEISIKFLLENAGFTVRELKKRSHNFNGLLTDICNCELAGTGISNSIPFSASRLLAQIVVPDTSNGTVGTLLTPEGAVSIYPNEIRYGELVTHYHPLYMLDCAKVVAEWADENFNRITKKETPKQNHTEKK